MSWPVYRTNPTVRYWNKYIYLCRRIPVIELCGSPMRGVSQFRITVHLLMGGRIPAIMLYKRANAWSAVSEIKVRVYVQEWTDPSHYAMKKSNANGPSLGSKSKSARTREWMDHNHDTTEKSNALGTISDIIVRVHLLMNVRIPGIILRRSPTHGALSRI